MRPVAAVVALAIAGAAGTLWYVWQSGGDCAGAPVHRRSDMCAGSGFSSARCADLLASADATLARSGPVYNTREQCEDRHATCQGSIGATGYVPRASGFCVRRGPPEAIIPVIGPR